jgi:hypothetical protein
MNVTSHYDPWFGMVCMVRGHAMPSRSIIDLLKKYSSSNSTHHRNRGSGSLEEIPEIAAIMS